MHIVGLFDLFIAGVLEAETVETLTLPAADAISTWLAQTFYVARLPHVVFS